MNGNDSAHTRCVSPIENETSHGLKHFENFFLPPVFICSSHTGAAQTVSARKKVWFLTELLATAFAHDLWQNFAVAE